MARTAPAPNAAAPPGMAPFTAVKGGGGAGGGSGGGGAGSGGGGAAGGAGSGGEGGGGGGKGADGSAGGGCGAGGSGGCPNPEHGGGGSAKAGDPVDVLTGRVFTTPAVDMVLAGPIPLIIRRSYSSFARDRDVGLGAGWCHSLAREITTLGRKLLLWDDAGRSVTLDPLELEEEVIVGREALVRYDWGYVLKQPRVEHVFQPIGASFKVTQIRDAYRNKIELRYDESGALTEILDSAGRTLRVKRHPDGHIAAFEVRNAPERGQWVSFVRYSYDSGDLVAATDANGHTTRFGYDNEHLLALVDSPSGRNTHYRYDPQQRCIETWVDRRLGGDPALDASVPDKLADGSRARGMLHARMNRYDDFVELVNSREVRQLFSNENGRYVCNVFGGGVSTAAYDDSGEMISHQDALGGTWTWERDEYGRAVSVTDPVGAKASWAYDERGRLREKTDAMGRRVEYTRNAEGDVVFARDDAGPIIEYRYDQRGLVEQIVLPNGAVTQLGYDNMGNRTLVKEPNGGVRHIHYDYFGRIVGYVDELGHQTYYTHGPCGELMSVREPNGAVTRYTYNADGYLASVVLPTGRIYKLSWAGYRHAHELRRPDGTSIRFRYDREGDMVRVVNAADEEHLVTRDGAGRVVEERTFDGRTTRFRVDVMGRTTRIEHDTHATDIDYDPIGRIVERRYADGTSESFRYDLNGRLLGAANESVECVFEYDLRGNQLREVQTLDGVSEVIERDFDPMGKPVVLKTSRGHEERVRYDGMSLPIELALDGDRLAFSWDLRGGEVERRLPGGADLAIDIDEMGWPRSRQLKSALDQRFVHDAEGMLTQVEDNKLGSTSYAYDALRQVLERVPTGAAEELFRYDRGENVHERNAPRRYDRGRLVHKGGTDYLYDASNRLIEKRVFAADGTAVWRYGWNGRGLLASVTAPNGEHVELVYDPFARRAVKRLRREKHRAPIVETRFVWSVDRLVHEVRSASDDIVEERTFATLPLGPPTPVAHRRVVERAGERSVEGWIYYVNDATHRPEALVDAQGDVLARMRGRVWGEIDYEPGARAETPFRFSGHFADDETGLFYNRYRYYDPTTGLYISPEPLGLEAGFLPFGYADNNPVNLIDPDGLKGMKATASGGGVSATRGSSSNEGKSAQEVMDAEGDDALHPVVKSALAKGHESDYGNPRKGAACAEPRAVSDYIKKYEEKHGPFESKEDVSKALSQMKVEASEDKAGKARAPCRNCSQFFANLKDEYGAPDQGNITPGATAWNKDDSTNFQPPKPGKKGHKKYPA